MTTREIESLDIRSLAKILGVMGLLWGLIVTISWTVAGLFGAPFLGLPELLASIVGGVVYGVLVCAITAIIYNAAASLIGGIRIDLA